MRAVTRQTLACLTTLIAVLIPIAHEARAEGCTSQPSAAVARATASPDEQPSNAVPDEDAVAYNILSDSCQGCHDLTMLARRPIAAEEWPGILDKMVGLGAGLSEDDRHKLERYLTKIYSSPAQTETAAPPPP
jgi:hypothetical protein